VVQSTRTQTPLGNLKPTPFPLIRRNTVSGEEECECPGFKKSVFLYACLPK
jgi:hypothetical protein